MPPLLPIHRVAGSISEVNVLSFGRYCQGCDATAPERLTSLYVDKEQHKQKWPLDALVMAQSE